MKNYNYLIMKRMTKLFMITGILTIAFSCFADGKNILQKLRVETQNDNNQILIAAGKPETKAGLLDDKWEDIDLVINTGETQLGGTLTIPNKLETSSLVIMSSGSGDQDRDETLDGFRVFKIIADHLASKGIASFRYDDRGVGTSTGNFVNSTLEDHVADLESIMDYFKSAEEHQFNEFTLLGHSQGGILAAKVAVGDEAVKKVILMGATAVPLVDVVLYQVRQKYRQTNIPKSIIEANVSAHNKLMRAIEDNRNIKEVLHEFRESTKAILYELSSTEQVADTLKIEKEATAHTNEFEIIYALPSLTSFLYYDPAKDFEKLEVPVLSLIGGLDKQVTIDQNKDRMENALLKSGTDYQLLTFDKANHLFQEAETGNRDEYATREKKFVDDSLVEISQWILRTE